MTERLISFVRWIFAISRPRIWIYTAGSFVLGFLFWHKNFSFFSNPDFLYLLVWLTLPANLFLYALNDAFDFETDLKNPKKDGFEQKSSGNDKNSLLSIAGISALTFSLLFFKLPLFLKVISILWFLIILTYNIPPFRFKSVPVADLIFAFNFPLWGVFGYYLASNELPSPLSLLLMALFAITMHIYTSSGDVEYDKNAGIKTISTALGSVNNSVLACCLLLVAIFIISVMAGILYISLIASLYLIFFLVQLIYSSKLSLFKWYSYFIFLHYITGYILTTSLIRI
jgi:4-hydroxybenzoate polyprenyltransferase